MLFQFNVTQFFQDVSNVVARIKTSRGIKVMTSPTRGEVMIRHKAECPKCGGMISTFTTQVPGVAVHVLHGKP